jgi:Thoeris protein ThsB, TIR-like domain/WD domain, G-beta repeat
VEILELSNVEMGAFCVRLLRKGERYGRQRLLIYEDDEPSIEFYGPAADGEQLAHGTSLGRWYAQQFMHPRKEWSSVGRDGHLVLSEENSHEIAAWLELELRQPWTPPPPPPPPPSQVRGAHVIELHQSGNRRVTLYVGGGFGYARREAVWARVERRPHAQYEDAIFVYYLPRGARKVREMILTWRPDLVIMLGWDHPDLQQALITGQGTPMSLDQLHSGGWTAATTKYSSGDIRYEQEFEVALDAYLTRNPLAQVLLDLRGEKVTNRKRGAQWADSQPENVLGPSGIRGLAASASKAELGPAAVFVSYHHGKDADARNRFERENGAAIRSSSIYPGEVGKGREVRREIRKRIAGCDFVVVLVGRGTYTRRWVDWEIHAALTCGPDGARKPIVGVLLPEAAELGPLLSAHLSALADRPTAELLRRSDELSRQLLAVTDTTLPARLMDNLLGGYATLMPWPASPDALLAALASQTGRAQPVNRRRLLIENLPLPSADVPDPGSASAESSVTMSTSNWPPGQSSRPEQASPSTRSQNTRRPENNYPDASPVWNAPSDSQTILPGKETIYRRGGSSMDRSYGGTVAWPELAALADHLTPEDSAAWLVRALHANGPAVVLAALGRINEPGYARLAAALGRHAHVLGPLDSEMSTAATLLARLEGDGEFHDLKAELKSMLSGPHLITAAHLPDLPPPGLIRVLRGGDPGIVAMAADPQGGWLASLAWNGTLRVWDITTGIERHILAQPPDAPHNSGRVLLTDPLGRWLAAAGPEGLVEVWDPIDGTKLHAFTSKYGAITALAVDPVGSWLAAADSIGFVQMWSMPAGRQLHEIFTGSPIFSMATDPLGNWLATGNYSTVQVWGVSQGPGKVIGPGGGPFA